MAELDLRTVRDGLRWHLIEARPRDYDWSSFLPMLRAATAAGVQVVWDLCHYGWPDDIDIWSPEFVERFAAFAAAAARVVRDETDAVPFYCPSTRSPTGPGPATRGGSTPWAVGAAAS